MNTFEIVFLAVATFIIVYSLYNIVNPKSEYNRNKKMNSSSNNQKSNSSIDEIPEDVKMMKSKFKENEEKANSIFIDQQATINKNREKKEIEKSLLFNKEKVHYNAQSSNSLNETLEIDVSSPNNKIHCISPINNKLLCGIENSKIGRSESISLDNIREVKDLLELILDCWAAQEIDKNFYPFASFPFKQYRNTYVKVVGMKYRDEEALLHLSILEVGAMMIMVPERSNPQDENAIRVLTADGFHVGYISMNDGYKVKEFSDGIVIGWMSTTWVKEKQSFSLAIVADKCRSSQLKSEDYMI